MTSTDPAPASPGRLRARRARIDTYQQAVVYMHRDCAVCRAEGFEAQAQVEVVVNGTVVPAILHRVEGDWLAHDEAALSEAAWELLGLEGGEDVVVRHASPIESLRFLRAKVYGAKLDYASMHALIEDISRGRVSDLHLAAFVTACSGGRLDLGETVALTRAMVDVGERIRWPMAPVMDKHCVGGLPGNRTTLIVVPIVAACGVVMPKTSSRAITSPAGTADTMETLAPVTLDMATMRRVVEREGACIAWGGAARLSPADDVLIRVERPLDLDSEAQLVASVLSKKVAAGSERVLIDLPIGPTAKVRNSAAARSLAAGLIAVGTAVGLQVQVIETDGLQPVGRGIGPALEAVDAMAVLQRAADAPLDLRQRALVLAGTVLEMAGRAAAGTGLALATKTLDSGLALAKFLAICQAQGGLREPPRAAHTAPVTAAIAGRVGAIDNRRLARAAKLAGAPHDAAAGAVIHVRLGDTVGAGQPLFTLHAQTPGELSYALSYVQAQPPIVGVDPA
ncbi:thymidine phosphorylase family protein [Ideonella sp.]|uniref:thymidine phosphorylase family protein n=1 Tax=Ideonella sp. TaxID=1929293 RepID=UPI0035AF03BB